MTGMTLIDLYNRAEAQGIEVDDVPMRALASASFPQNWIAMDSSKFETTAAEKVAIAHEIGHVETGGFYNIYSPFDLRSKHEARADKQAISMLIPLDDLFVALHDGMTEPWQLAEHFDVPDTFVQKALDLYADPLRKLTVKNQ